MPKGNIISILFGVMNNTNYAEQIVNNLEAKGESKDFIIGFLQATLDGLRHLDNPEVTKYIQQTVKQTKSY